MLSERPSAAVADPPPPLSSPSSNMADRQENNNTRQSPARSSSSTETAGAGGHLSTEQKRMFRFLHSALAIVSLLWITVCLLIYFHAPSYQVHRSPFSLTSLKLKTCKIYLDKILPYSSLIARLLKCINLAIRCPKKIIKYLFQFLLKFYLKSTQTLQNSCPSCRVNNCSTAAGIWPPW